MAMKMKRKTRINYQNNCWKCEWCTNYYWPKREIGDRAHWRVDRKKVPSLERACRHWGRRFWRHYQWLCCVKRWSSTRSRTVSLATLKPPISQRGRPLIGGSTHLLWTQPYRMTASLLRTKSKNMNEVRDERRRRFWNFGGGGGWWLSYDETRQEVERSERRIWEWEIFGPRSLSFLLRESIAML